MELITYVIIGLLLWLSIRIGVLWLIIAIIRSLILETKKNNAYIDIGDHIEVLNKIKDSISVDKITGVVKFYENEDLLVIGEYFEKLHNEIPQNEVIAYNLAYILCRLEQYEKASNIVYSTEELGVSRKTLQLRTVLNKKMKQNQNESLTGTVVDDKKLLNKEIKMALTDEVKKWQKKLKELVDSNIETKGNKNKCAWILLKPLVFIFFITISIVIHESFWY